MSSRCGSFELYQAASVLLGPQFAWILQIWNGLFESSSFFFFFFFSPCDRPVFSGLQAFPSTTFRVRLDLISISPLSLALAMNASTHTLAVVVMPLVLPFVSAFAAHPGPAIITASVVRF